MRELDLYQVEEDERLLVSRAFEGSCIFVPDVHYKVPEAYYLRTLEAFQNARAGTRHFYILKEPYSKSPFSMREVSKEGEVFYYASPGVGTPSLEFLAGGLFEEKPGTPLIRPGFLAFSREYWSLDLSQKLSSPRELEILFDELCRVVKASSSRVKPGKKVFWLGDNARVALESGARLVGYESWSPHLVAQKSS